MTRITRRSIGRRYPRAPMELFAEDGGTRPPWWQAARGALRAERAPADAATALAVLASGA